MKASEIRNLSVQELNEKLSDLKSELSTCVSSTRSTSSRTPCVLALSRRTSPVLRPSSGRKSSLSASNFERRTTECLREI